MMNYNPTAVKTVQFYYVKKDQFIGVFVPIRETLNQKVKPNQLLTVKPNCIHTVC